MKNDSFFHPFSTPIDSCFDSNNDGELTGCETAFRDAALFEMYDKATTDSSPSNSYSSHQKNYKAYTPSNTPTDSEQYDPPSDGTVLWSSIGVIAIIIGAFAIILSQETHDDLLNAIVIFFSVALSVSLLKITGVMSSKKKANKQDDDTSYYESVNNCFNYENDDRNDQIKIQADDFEEAHKKHEEMGCICFENHEMGIYFIEDPDGYWLEILP